jgi:hypothetical protein
VRPGFGRQREPLAPLSSPGFGLRTSTARRGARRPDRAAEEIPVARHVRMPSSTSFPSGHSAAAFAFATGVGHVLPPAAIPLRGLAALIAYSRVHTGVHCPGDVVAGALMGTTLARLTTHALDRAATHRRLNRLTSDDRLIVSEPFSDLPGLWQEIPPAGAVTVRYGGELEHRPFRPAAATAPAAPGDRAATPDR